jgi:hypothetical protein
MVTMVSVGPSKGFRWIVATFRPTPALPRPTGEGAKQGTPPDPQGRITQFAWNP